MEIPIAIVYLDNLVDIISVDNFEDSSLLQIKYHLDHSVIWKQLDLDFETSTTSRSVLLQVGNCEEFSTKFALEVCFELEKRGIYTSVNCANPTSVLYFELGDSTLESSVKHFYIDCKPQDSSSFGEVFFLTKSCCLEARLDQLASQINQTFYVPQSLEVSKEIIFGFSN